MQQPCSTQTPKDGKPRRNKRRLDDPSQTTKELHTVNQLLSQSEPSMPENEAFGRYVTSALNKLPERELIMAQNDIQNILTRYRLNMISAPSPCEYVSYTPHKETP
ncbi:hypothetical protein GDO78_001393 [Eleutherodactylus coqui]|uniref:BESS domain-containing protein n=2 Tax=Eleutherodactylus coqui TaxID=57060 RepID=A0A8J6FTY5_ELECQ|nr:hypothetical protein GDO78_001393 [Eleutherodactylus coqui]